MGQALHDLADIEPHIATELERRLAEDDASPDDAIAWEAIKAEAQARWRHQSRSNQ